MPNLFYTTLFLFLIGAFHVVRVDACHCSDYDVPYCEQVSRADTVFIGRVKTTPPADNSPGIATVLVDFKVEKVFKGTLTSTVQVGSSSVCGPGKFEAGMRWVVYGYKTSDGNLYMPLCGGTHPYRDGDEDITLLDNVRKGVARESVRGWLRSYDGPVSDLPVLVSGDGKTLTTKSDEEGRFEVPVARAGKYKVSVSVPFAAVLSISEPSLVATDVFKTETLSGFTYEAKVDKGLCSYQRLEFLKADPKE